MVGLRNASTKYTSSWGDKAAACIQASSVQCTRSAWQWHAPPDHASPIVCAGVVCFEQQKKGIRQAQSEIDRSRRNFCVILVFVKP